MSYLIDESRTHKPSIPCLLPLLRAHRSCASKSRWSDRALVFYCDIPGFTLTQCIGYATAFIAAGDYHHYIVLNSWESLGGSSPPARSTGLYHLAILYPTRYKVRGYLIGGFAIIPWTVEYGRSGIKPFMTNHDCVIYEKDLGQYTTTTSIQQEPLISLVGPESATKHIYFNPSKATLRVLHYHVGLASFRYRLLESHP